MAYNFLSGDLGNLPEPSIAHQWNGGTMDKPILYYWAPCTTCAIATKYANEHGIELDLRDVEYEGPYNELVALGGDANQIPYFYDGEQLVEGLDAVLEHLKTIA